jgi:hypothetical protein
MKRTLVLSCVLSAAWLAAGCGGSGGGGTVPSGPVADYRDSTAEVVVLNFFDMYCHTCQTMASHVGELQRMVRQRGLDSRIGFYAIGWGNSPMESEMYRKRFGVGYPVIPDPELVISKRFGRFRPPLLIALRRQGGGWSEIARFTDLRGDKEEILAKITP